MWTPIEADQFPAPNRLAGWFWAAGDKAANYVRLALMSGSVGGVSQYLFRLPTLAPAEAACLASGLVQHVAWSYDHTDQRYLNFLGWVSLSCTDARLFAAQLRSGFVGVTGLGGGHGYMI